MSELKNVKIGDEVNFVVNDKKMPVVVTDVIRCIFSREPIALEFEGRSGHVQFPMEYFQSK